MIEHLKNFFGFIASAVTVATGVASCLSVFDPVIKTGIGLLGLIAGWYAARYWKYRWDNRDKKEASE